MNHLVALSFAKADLRYAELLYAVLTERLGKTRDVTGVDEENVYFYPKKDDWQDTNLNQQLHTLYDASKVIVGLIGPTYDRSGPCRMEANVILDRIKNQKFDRVILAVIDDAPLPSLLGTQLSFAGVEVFPLKRGTSSWDGLCDIRRLANLVYRKLRNQNELVDNPRYSTPLGSLPGAVARHFGGQLRNDYLQAAQVAHKEGLLTSARFAAHIEQDVRAEVLCTGLREVGELCATDFSSVAIAPAKLNAGFRRIKDRAASLLATFASPIESLARWKLDVRCALLLRFENYLHRHFPNEPWVAWALLEHFTDLTLPEQVESDAFSIAATSLNYEALTVSNAIEQRFLSRNLVGEPIESDVELAAFGVRQDEFLARSEVTWPPGTTPW
jgi:hypothetical protein